MKIVLLSSLFSIHTIRWANVFCLMGHEVHVISIQKAVDAVDSSVHVHMLSIPAPFGYFFNVHALRSLIKEIRPDVINVHYASGYGTLARLAKCHPYVLSVWGSDVYDFPEKSPWHLRLIQQNLMAADCVCSTSCAMAHQTHKIYPNIPLDAISITPFGVDTTKFQPLPEVREPNVITIGTVKTLASKYGIDTLLRAFSYAYDKLDIEVPSLAKKMRLVIVGGGPQEAELKELAISLGIDKKCEWKGKVSHDEVPRYLNQFDVYVALSRLDSESFGVAIIEASACGIPVVVSDAGGLPEVVRDGETGVVVPRDNPEEAGKALVELIKNNKMRSMLGAAGRLHVQNKYEWSQCGKTLISCLVKTKDSY